MGVFEVGRVFEAEGEEAVEANVGGPDQGDGEELRFGGEERDCEQDTRSDVNVLGLVSMRNRSMRRNVWLLVIECGVCSEFSEVSFHML